MSGLQEPGSENPGDFRRFIERYEDYVFTIALRVLGDRESARDAAQETFIKIYRNLDRLDKEKNEKNWVCTIALNTCRDHHRKRQREAHVGLESVEIAARSVPLDERLFAREILRKLPLAFREILVLFYMEDKSVKEIAALLRRPEIVVKVRLFRARKAARKLLEGGAP